MAGGADQRLCAGLPGRAGGEPEFNTSSFNHCVSYQAVGRKSACNCGANRTRYSRGGWEVLFLFGGMQNERVNVGLFGVILRSRRASSGCCYQSSAVRAE